MREHNYNVEVMNNLEKCGVISCLHCIGGLCGRGECDLYERVVIQEY
ncbi:MAG: hypothetical protein KGZ33_02015 [Alkaliphilus sp.]|nr:hypothetical protein [Alkaliphilus sp.]